METNCTHSWERRSEYDSPRISGAKRFQCSQCNCWGFSVLRSKNVRLYTKPVTEADLEAWKQELEESRNGSLSDPIGTNTGRWGNGMVDCGPGKKSLRPTGYESQRERDRDW